MTRPLVRLVPLAALLIGAVACGGPSEPTTYSLPLTQVAPAADGPRWGDAVLVDGFRADSVLAHRALAWREAATPNEIHTYSKHLWNQAPPRIVQDHIVSCLRSADAFSLVAYPYERGETDLVLAGELRAFEQTINAGGAARAHIAIDISLSERNRGGLVMQERLTIEAPATDISPAAAVTAFQGALRGLCGALLTRLGALR